MAVRSKDAVPKFGAVKLKRSMIKAVVARQDSEQETNTRWRLVHRVERVLFRTLAADSYASADVRLTPIRTEIIIRATREARSMGEKVPKDS